MPFPATHVLFNIGLFYPFRKYFGKYWFVFAGFSGLLPDLDFGIQIIISFFGLKIPLLEHGMFFHSIGLVLLLGLIGLIVFLKNKEYGKYVFILAIGSLLHILLDYVLGGGRYYLLLLYPFSEIGFRLHLLESFGSDGYGILDAVCIFCSMVWLFILLKKDSFKK